LLADSKFRAVLFDLDGTLLDTLEDLADCMNDTLSRFGFPVHPTEKYKYFVGDGMENLVRRAVPETARTDPATVSACLGMMRRLYGENWAKRSRPYDGVPELLDALRDRGLPLAVLSNKPDVFTRDMVGKLLPRWRFEAVFGERPPVPRKPHPGAALEIASLLRVEPRNFLYLGDTGTDMTTANAAGMYAVGVLWGFREAGELAAAGAKKLIRTPAELLDLL